MRKLQTKEEIEKKRKLNNIILSTLMLLILLLSTLGFAFLSNPFSSNNENNPQQDSFPSDRISFVYQGTPINLLSTYDEIENITINITKRPQDYSGKTLYINSENQGALQELAINLQKFSSNIQQACYGSCEENLPEKNCTDELIIFNESLENKVYQQDNCIFIDGDIGAVDSFLFKLFSKI